MNLLDRFHKTRRPDPDPGRTSSVIAPELDSLIPEYVEADHGVYLTILKRAIDEQVGVRNIALSGTYGTGKSSILAQVAADYPKRVIELSLSTLGTHPTVANAGTSSSESVGSAADFDRPSESTTNRIQKEIVKQLLYQQKPSAAPESRFRRISRFPRWREYGIALGVAVLVVCFIVAIGLDDPAALLTRARLVDPPAWLRTAAGYVATGAAAGLVVYFARLVLHDRLSIEKVSAGPATITLPPRSSSYFDEYLDEIIYFFETNKRRDIVIIEDLDRFNDPYIFESLRSLNGLLNAAKQLQGRRIRFIYAVRDSIFEKRGRDKGVSTTDDATAELVLANRTKFFDLVVPVVPFITHRNARDLMHTLLTARRHAISKDLVNLAAHHVADMRLIRNVVNEYEVFKSRLVDVPNPVPELDNERLFAMILFKNAHMAEFEAIRLGESSLDRLYDLGRSLVSSNLRRLREEAVELKTRIDGAMVSPDAAERLASELTDFIDVLARAAESGTDRRANTGLRVSGEVQVDGRIVSSEELRTTEFWHDLATANSSITVFAGDGSGRRHRMVFSELMLQDILSHPLDLMALDEYSMDDERAALRENERDASLLQHHTWGELMAAPRFMYPLSGDSAVGEGEVAADGVESMPFRQWAKKLLPSDLAVDLVDHGYITSYFPLHVSSFYGQLIRLDAMNYILRNIDSGTPDADYILDHADVEAILRDRGDGVLDDRSMYNISILDYLLERRVGDAKKLVVRLAGWGREEREFVAHYLSAGFMKKEFVEHLTPVLPVIFTYLSAEAPLGADERSSLMDVALSHLDLNMKYESSDQLRAFIESEYRNFPLLSDSDRSDEARWAARFIDGTGAVFSSVAGLQESVRDVLKVTHRYAITAENLELLAGTDNIALDRLKEVSRAIYIHSAGNLDAYLMANKESPGTSWTIESPAIFQQVLDDVARNSNNSGTIPAYSSLVHRASPGCKLGDLLGVPFGAWPALVASLRVPPTLTNVAAYTEWAGGIDKEVAALLASAGKILDVDDHEVSARRALAVTIVNSPEHLPVPALRVQLANSLQPGQLEALSLNPEPGPLVALLLEAGLLADDEATFTHRLMVDWPTLEDAIARSNNYAEFVSRATLPAGRIVQLMESQVAHEVKVAVIESLDELATLAAADVHGAMAQYALRSRTTLSGAQIETLYQGGTPETVVIELLAAAGEGIVIDDVRQILRSIGGEYAKMADRGNRLVRLDDTTSNLAIVRRLQRAGIVSKNWADDDLSIGLVTMRRP